MARQQQVRVGRGRRTVAATVLGLGLAVAAASCTSSGTPAATSSGPTAPGSTIEKAAAPTTTRPHSSSTTTTTTTADDSPSTTSDPNELTPASIVVHAVPGQEGYCGSIATAMQDLSAAALAALGGGDPGYADQALQDVKDLYRRLADDAPDEIKADVQRLSAALDAIDDAKDLRHLEDDPAAVEAGARFTTWITANCGFDPNNPAG